MAERRAGPHDPGNPVLAVQRHCLVPAFRRGALALSPGGALLSAWNFFALIKFVPKVISAGWSKSSLFALLLRTNMRLLFTGILLYMVLVWFKGSISAVLLGLAVLLVGMTAGGLKKALKKPV